MTALLTDNLPLLAGAPNGIKKLRELILELAVRGKLVEQDASDEPASELLKRIAEEKARLVAEGKIKKNKSEEYDATELAYPIPTTWAVACLGQVVEIVRGITFPASEKSRTPEPGRVACLRTANVQDEIEWDDLLFIRESFVSRDDQYVQPHDIVMSMANSRELVGKVALVGAELAQKTSFGGFLGVLRPVFVEPRFVMALLRTPHARSALIDSSSQTTNIANVSLAKLRPLPFAIPPLAEQHRIVAKVDELMDLCDRLEAQQADAVSAHAQLVQALLGSLTQTSDATEFAANWQRLAEHFHTLFSTEPSIDALKQTLLQLAVMGKLVPQDASDEPASELLERIQAEKRRLTSEEGLRTTAREDVPAAERNFTLCSGWECSRLGNLARFIDYRGRTPTKTISGIPLITAKNVRPGFISREPQEFIAEEDYSSWMTRGFPRLGDILFTTEAPMGNIALIDIAGQFALAQRVICFQLHELEIGPFLRLAMMSSGFQMQLSDAATGMTATGIKSSRLKEIPVPIPPLPEQHRIVAKVDQLMALCDQLKTQLSQARQLNQQLASTLVEQAVA